MARHAYQVDKRKHLDPSDIEVGYPQEPTAEPGLVGGPAVTATPGGIHGTNSRPLIVTDDGGETTLSGQPRDEAGDRPLPAASAKKQKRLTKG